MLFKIYYYTMLYNENHKGYEDVVLVDEIETYDYEWLAEDGTITFHNEDYSIKAIYSIDSVIKLEILDNE